MRKSSRSIPDTRSRSNAAVRRLLYAALVLLYLLHNDFWNWRDSSLVLGLPVALHYHLSYCLAAAGLYFLLVRWAWPDNLSADQEERPD